MSWKDDVDELARQTELARQMGGEDSVAFHHSRGKLTIRERVDLLADAGSFYEIGPLAGSATWEGDQVRGLKPSNTIIGTCRINDRKVAFFRW